jgi:dihydropteroate synthase
MGVINCTPDSFFDASRVRGVEDAHARVERLLAEGADIVDVGAESTRPGAPAVGAAEQIARLGDLVPWAVARGALVSVDTTSPEVAAPALADGARMVNSVSLAPAAELGRLCAAHGASLVLGHARGPMRAMTGPSEWPEEDYGDVVADVARQWRGAAALALAAGLPPERLLCDPGLGFTKSAAQSLELCARLAELKRRVAPHRLVVGPGRKSYLAHAVARVIGGEPPPPEERLGATVAAALDCAARGADVLRVHDVGVVRQALAYATAVGARAGSGTRDAAPGSLSLRGGADA